MDDLMTDQRDLARQALVAALKYASAVVVKLASENPDQATALAASGAQFSFRATDILGSLPRVVLTATVDGVEREVAHSDIKRVADNSKLCH